MSYFSTHGPSAVQEGRKIFLRFFLISSKTTKLILLDSLLQENQLRPRKIMAGMWFANDGSMPNNSRFAELPPQLRRSLKKPKKALPLYCVFCKNNEERVEVYESHVLKDMFDRVVWPALFAHKCEICGNTGHQAHTKRHCPYNPEKLRKEQEFSRVMGGYSSKGSGDGSNG
jgi:Nanos RNA binding domain